MLFIHSEQNGPISLISANTARINESPCDKAEWAVEKLGERKRKQLSQCCLNEGWYLFIVTTSPSFVSEERIIASCITLKR